MKYSSVLLVCLFFAVVLASAYALGRGNVQECDKWWERAWSLAKDGDLEARAQISDEMSLNRFMIIRNPSDIILRQREYLIWRIHSLGLGQQADYSRPENAELRRLNLDSLFGVSDNPSRVFTNNSFRRFVDRDSFGRCMLEKANQDCVRLAVEPRIVPSFENYVKELDLALQRGAQIKCNF